MKRCFSLMLVLVGVIIMAAPAHPVPVLQLDIVGGSWYDSSTQTIVTDDGNFMLYALFDASQKKSPPLSDLFYFSAALVPTVSNPAGNPVFSITDLTAPGNPVYTSTTSPSYGTPQGLPRHGIFPTSYWEIPFQFSSLQVAQYNSQDYPGGFGTETDGSGKLLYYAQFDVEVSALNGYQIYFDLYHYSANPGKVDLNAPFSHNAAVVPEPATMFLFGVGLIGLAGLGRKRLFKRT